MSSCDICGKPADVRAIVEGAEVNVCPRCARFGKVVNKLSNQPTQYTSEYSAVTILPEVELARGYGKLIETARIASGFSRIDLAKKLNMREADLLHFEEEKRKPTEPDARKLEAVLKIKLLSASQFEPSGEKKSGAKPLTLGDVIVIKDKRRKGELK